MDHFADVNADGYRLVPGYHRAPDTLQPRTLFVFHHAGRLWEFRCSKQTDMAFPRSPDGEAYPGVLAFLALGLLLHSVQAMCRRATIALGGKWCRSGVESQVRR